MYKVILASGSPRRREILDQVGIKYECAASNKEEIVDTDDAVELVKNLSKMKAEDVASRYACDYVLIGADTVVEHKGSILGKPKTAENAVKMIKSLQNDVHYVHTGVTIILNEAKGRITETFSVSTKVSVAPMTDEQIDAYVNTGEPLDKAGGYAIQGKFAPYISEISGDYYNIVGFPIAAICRTLENMGVYLL